MAQYLYNELTKYNENGFEVDLKTTNIIKNSIEKRYRTIDTIFNKNPQYFVKVNEVWKLFVDGIFKTKVSQNTKTEAYRRFILYVKHIYPDRYYDKINYIIERDGLKQRKQATIVLVKMELIDQS